MFNRKKILALALAGTLLLQTSLVAGAAPLETSGNGLAGIAQAISAKQVNVKEDAGGTTSAIAAPTITTIFAGEESVMLMWEAPEADGITGYEVSSNGGEAWTSIDSAETLVHAFEGLENEKVYTFLVRAVKDGEKGTAAECKAKPGVTTSLTPNAPKNFSASMRTNSAELSWEAADGAVAGYEVSKDDGEWIRLEADTLTYTYEGLSPNTEYTFKVRTVNSTNASSEETSTQTTQSEAVSTIAAPAITTIFAGEESVMLMWEAPEADGITGYEVCSDGGEDWTSIDSAETLVHTFEGLGNETIYTFMVRAVKDEEKGTAAECKAKPGITTSLTPNAPQNVIVSMGPNSAELSWEAADGAVAGYEVSKGGEEWIRLGVDTLTYTFENLSPDAEYTFKVRTINGTNASDEIIATDDTNPDQPEIRTIGVEARYSSNNIRFGAVENATSYEVFKSETENGEYTRVGTVTPTDDQDVYSYIDESADTGTQLWYKVEAVVGEERVEIGPAQDTYQTGIEAVQQHAKAEQYHIDFVSGNNTNFDGNRMDSGTQEQIEKIKGVSEGAVFVAIKPANVEGAKVIFAVTDSETRVPTGNNPYSLPNGTGMAIYQQGGQMRIDFSNSMKSNFANTAPANEWSSFAFVSNTGATGHKIISSYNGTASTSYPGDNLTGMFSHLTNLSKLTIGAVGTNKFLPFRGEVAYITITDEVFTQEEINEYTQAVNEALRAADNPAPTRPAAPANFQATPGNGQVSLSWTAVSGTVTRYEVSKDNGTSWENASSNTAHTFTGLTNGTSYTFKVRAVNEAGNGAESSVTATPQAPQAETVATPTFSPAGGTYTEAKSVTITSQTSGATIYYTTDGSAPTTSSTRYTTPVNVDRSMTIKAIAVKDGMTNSAVATATYTINQAAVATPTFSPAGGTYTEAKSVTITSQTSGATIYYTTDGSAPTTNSTRYTAPVNVDRSMTIKAIAVKDGMTNSAVATAAYTINKAAVAAPAFSPAGGTYTEAKSVTITSQTSGAAIYYTTDGSAPTTSSTRYTAPVNVDKSMTIKAIAVKDGMTNSEVATAVYVINKATEKVAAPVFTPKAGTYDKAQNVTISSATAGAAIYYTTDGSAPTVNSTRYTGAVKVNKSMTIKAIAVKDGMTNSEVATAAYVIKIDKPFPFSDVAKNSGWKYDSVKYVYDNDIMNGISGTNTFQPDSPLTRAMFATVLYRMAGQPEVKFVNKFTDVADGQWYSKAIIWANAQGIVSGFTDGSYGINKNITREQISKMLYEYADKTCKYDVSAVKALTSFTDAGKVNGWASGYMKWATAVGMISGKPNGDGSYRLDPQGEATRAECAAMLMRFQDKYK